MAMMQVLVWMALMGMAHMATGTEDGDGAAAQGNCLTYNFMPSMESFTDGKRGVDGGPTFCAEPKSGQNPKKTTMLEGWCVIFLCV